MYKWLVPPCIAYRAELMLLLMGLLLFCSLRNRVKRSCYPGVLMWLNSCISLQLFSFVSSLKGYFQGLSCGISQTRQCEMKIDSML